MTRKGKTLYLHVFGLPRSPIVVQGIFTPVLQVRLLHRNETLNFEQQPKHHLSDGRIHINLPSNLCDPISTVIAVDFTEEPDWP